MGLKESYKESFLSSPRFVLASELVLTTASLATIYYLWSGSSELMFLFNPVAAIMMVPFFSTCAYYRGFEKASKASLGSAIAAPVLGVFLLLAAIPSGQASGILAVLGIFAVAFGSAIVPYLLLVGALILHVYREEVKRK